MLPCAKLHVLRNHEGAVAFPNGQKYKLFNIDPVIVDTLHRDCGDRVTHALLPFSGHQPCATGLIAGCPTTVVPFFGDQPFWGAACARMAVGPKPIPIDKLSTPLLVEALKFMMKPEVQAAAKDRGQGIKNVSFLGAAQLHAVQKLQVICCMLYAFAHISMLCAIWQPAQ